MSLDLLVQIEKALFGTAGSYVIIAMLIISFLAIGFLFAGIDLRVALLILMPVFIAFGASGWLPGWVTGLAWIVLIGFSLFIMWNWIRER